MINKKIGSKIITALVVVAILVGCIINDQINSKANESINDTKPWSEVDANEDESIKGTALFEEYYEKFDEMSEEEIIAIFTSEEYSRQFEATYAELFKVEDTIISRNEPAYNDKPVVMPPKETFKDRFKSKLNIVKERIDEITDKIADCLPKFIKKKFSHGLKLTIKNVIIKLCEYCNDDKNNETVSKLEENIANALNIDADYVKLFIEMLVKLIDMFVKLPENKIEGVWQVSICDDGALSITNDGENVSDENYSIEQEDNFIVEQNETNQDVLNNELVKRYMEQLGGVLYKEISYAVIGKKNYYGIITVSKKQLATEEEILSYLK